MHARGLLDDGLTGTLTTSRPRARISDKPQAFGIQPTDADFDTKFGGSGTTTCADRLRILCIIGLAPNCPQTAVEACGATWQGVYAISWAVSTV